MPHIFGYHARTSGRDLTQVRRPRRMAPGRPVVVAPTAPASTKDLDAILARGRAAGFRPGETTVLEPAELTKPDLTNLAAAVGVESTGTKADVLKRVKKQTDG